MTKRLTVETDGDHYPKDVYLVGDDGVQRLATIEGHNEVEMKHLAKAICTAFNACPDLLSALKALICAIHEKDVGRASFLADNTGKTYEEHFEAALLAIAKAEAT